MSHARKIRAGHYEVEHNGGTWTVKASYFLGAVHWLAYAPGDAVDQPTIDRPTLGAAVAAIRRRKP